MAKANNRKNPMRNKRNIRRKKALIRAQDQLDFGGYTNFPTGKTIPNSDKRKEELQHEVLVLKERIMM